MSQSSASKRALEAAAHFQLIKNLNRGLSSFPDIFSCHTSNQILFQKLFLQHQIIFFFVRTAHSYHDFDNRPPLPPRINTPNSQLADEEIRQVFRNGITSPNIQPTIYEGMYNSRDLAISLRSNYTKRIIIAPRKRDHTKKF